MSSDEDMEPSMDTAPPEEAMVEAFIHTLGGQLTAMEEMTPSATDIADMIDLIEYSKLRVEAEMAKYAKRSAIVFKDNGSWCVSMPLLANVLILTRAIRTVARLNDDWPSVNALRPIIELGNRHRTHLECTFVNRSGTHATCGERAEEDALGWRCRRHSAAKTPSLMANFMAFVEAFPKLPDYTPGSAINLDKSAQRSDVCQLGCNLCKRHTSLEAVLAGIDDMEEGGELLLSSGFTFKPSLTDDTALMTEALDSGARPLFCQACLVQMPDICGIMAGLFALAKMQWESISGLTHSKETVDLANVAIDDTWVFRTPAELIPRSALKEAAEVLNHFNLPVMPDYKISTNARPPVSPDQARLLDSRKQVAADVEAGLIQPNARTRVQHLSNLNAAVATHVETPPPDMRQLNLHQKSVTDYWTAGAGPSRGPAPLGPLPLCPPGFERSRPPAAPPGFAAAPLSPAQQRRATANKDIALQRLASGGSQGYHQPISAAHTSPGRPSKDKRAEYAPKCSHYPSCLTDAHWDPDRGCYAEYCSRGCRDGKCNCRRGNGNGHQSDIDNKISSLTATVASLANVVGQLVQTQQTQQQPAAPAPAPAQYASPGTSAMQAQPAFHTSPHMHGGSAPASGGYAELLPRPPAYALGDDVDTDVFGFKGSSPHHALHPDMHLHVDYCASARQTAASDEKRCLDNFVRSINGHHRIDVAAGQDLNRFTPLGAKYFATNDVADLGQGMTIQSAEKEFHIPRQSQWNHYANRLVLHFAERLNSPTGPFAMSSQWGPYRRWQAKYVISVLQLLSALDHHLTVERSPELSWNETWCYKCALVACYFYSTPIVVDGLHEKVLKMAMTSTEHQLRTLTGSNPLLKNAVKEATDPDLIAHAKDTARKIDIMQAPKAAAAALQALAAAPAAAVGRHQPAVVNSPKSEPSLCSVPGCAWSYATGFKCTHDFTVPCNNPVKLKNNATKTACGIAHARSGPRKWACKAAYAAKQILSQADLLAAFKMSDDKFFASSGHAQADAVKQAALDA